MKPYIVYMFAESGTDEILDECATEIEAITSLAIHRTEMNSSSDSDVVFYYDSREDENYV